MAVLDGVIAQVAGPGTLDAKVSRLLGGLRGLLEDALYASDLARVQAIADALSAQDAAVRAAVAANPNPPEGRGL